MSSQSVTITTPRAPDIARANRRVATIVSESGTSFGYGMKILRRPRREAMFAIYAFCRAVDDIADAPGPVEEKLRALGDWRRSINTLYDTGRVKGPITCALHQPIQRYALPRDEFLGMIDGMEMDVRGPIRAPDWQTLKLYCRRVAGTVGLLSIRAFGAGDDPQTQEFALALAEALQLTNILRDIAEDAGEGRLYLPREALVAAGIDSTEPSDVLAHPRLHEVAEAVSAQAWTDFQRADALLEHCDRKALRPALLMLGAYEAILTRLTRRGWLRVLEPLPVSKTAKLWAGIARGLLR